MIKTVAVITHASIKVGIGHYYRSLHFVEQNSDKYQNIRFEFIVITDLDIPIPHDHRYCQKVFRKESDFEIEKYDTVFIDLLEADEDFINQLRQASRILVSLSPIFNHFEYVDYVFSREMSPKMMEHSRRGGAVPYCGAEYAILGGHVKRIPTVAYRKVVRERMPSIAICMGGTDPEKLTFQIVERIAEWTSPAILWILISSYFPHDINELRRLASADTQHEVVIASSQRSLWDIASNCSVAILQGGLTTYEAIYAGLPSINIPKNEESTFLLNGIVSEGLGWRIENVEMLSGDFLTRIFSDTDALVTRHKKCKRYVDDSASLRILETVERMMEKTNEEM